MSPHDSLPTAGRPATDAVPETLGRCFRALDDERVADGPDTGEAGTVAPPPAAAAGPGPGDDDDDDDDDESGGGSGGNIDPDDDDEGPDDDDDDDDEEPLRCAPSTGSLQRNIP